MGKSYIVKYIAVLSENKKYRTTIAEMRLQDIIVRTAHHRKGLKTGDKIQVWEQTSIDKNYILNIKKDINVKPVKMISRENTGLSEKNNDIQFRNQWYIPRSYYQVARI